MATFIMAQGKRPPRPTHPYFTEKLWALMQRCWDHEPRLRPEVSEVLQVLLTMWVPRLFRWPSAHEFDYTLIRSDLPTWKRLISPHLSVDKRMSLIASIFADRDEVQAIEYLSGDDAQDFVDAIDKVNSRTISYSKAANTATETFTFY